MCVCHPFMSLSQAHLWAEVNISGQGAAANGILLAGACVGNRGALAGHVLGGDVDNEVGVRGAFLA